MNGSTSTAGPVVPRRQALAQLASVATAAGAIALPAAASAAHPDRWVFAACIDFERADRAFTDATMAAAQNRPGSPGYAAATAIADEARRLRQPALRNLCSASPATIAGHVARVRQVLRVAARFSGDGIEPLHYVDAPLLAAVFRDLALLDQAPEDAR